MEQQLALAIIRLSELYKIIAVVGLLLVAMLAITVYKTAKTERLSKLRSKKDALADLLNSAFEPRPGVIVCKNGALMAAFSYEGADINAQTNLERNETSIRLNRLFASVDSGWMFHIDCVRAASPKYPDKSRSAFPDRISAAIDEERRDFFEREGNSYNSSFVMTLTWLPPLKKAKKIEAFLYTGGAKAGSARQQTEDLIDEFEKKLENFQNSLSVIFRNVRRLTTEQIPSEDGRAPVYQDFLLSWLYFCITGINQRVLMPETPVYLDTILGAQDLETGFDFQIGKKHGRVIAVEGLAGATYPSMLTMLGELGCEFRFSTRFIALDKNESTALLSKFRRKWAMKERGILSVILDKAGKVNQDAANMVAEADDAITAVSSGEVAWGFVTQCLVLMDDDLQRLEENVLYAVRAVEKLGLTCRVEKQNALDAFFGSLPGHGYENVRRPLVSTANLADIIPVSTPWVGSANAPCDFYPENSPCLLEGMTGASWTSVFRFNFHVKDLGHTLVLGPTGAGKSTFLCVTAAQALRYRGMRIFSFDKGMSMYALCKACGGRHFVPGKDPELSFCPLGSIQNREDLAWASNWIQTLLLVNNVTPTSEQTNEINSALENMIAARKLEKGYDMSLTSFRLIIQDPQIRSILTQYCQDSATGTLIDAKSDDMGDSNFNVFEIEPLMNLGEKYALPVLLYLFHRIENSLTGAPAIVYLDEAWLMLGHPAFAGKIREWLKVMRKKNCAIIMATQSLADLKESPIYSTLIESTATKVFLPNPTAMQESTMPLYMDFGLNIRQIQSIAQGIKKLNYYVVQELFSRMVNLELGPLTLAFCGVSDPDKIRRIDELIAAFGADKWQEQWLAENKLALPTDLRYGN